MEELKKVIEDSGLHVVEFSLLANVHRITVHHWLNGRGIRQRNTFTIVNKLVELIKEAVKMELLPLKNLPKAERMPAIRAALRMAHSKSA